MSKRGVRMIEKICNEIGITSNELIIKLLQQENKQLKDNWNKLKEIIKKEQDYYMYRKDNRYRGFLYKLSEKMQELQGSDSYENKRSNK